MHRLWEEWVQEPGVQEKFDELTEEAENVAGLMDVSTFRKYRISVPSPLTVEDVSLILAKIARIEARMLGPLSELSMKGMELDRSDQRLALAWRGVVSEAGDSPPEWRVAGYYTYKTWLLWGDNVNSIQSYVAAWKEKLDSLRRVANRAKESVDLLLGGAGHYS